MTDLRTELAGLPRGVSDDELGKIEADARRKAKAPKPRQETFADEGYYNAVMLEEPAAALVSVVEGKDQPAECVLEGQRVRKLDGPFAPPVSVSYITQAEHHRYHREVAALAEHVLERLAVASQRKE